MADEAIAQRAAEIAHDQIEQRIQQTVDAITAGGALGFTANTTPQNELAYYQRQCFNLDGTPNWTAIQDLQQRIGIQGWADTVAGFTADAKRQLRGG